MIRSNQCILEQGILVINVIINLYPRVISGHTISRVCFRKGDIKTHIQSVHEKTKYSCDQCDHQATSKNQLKIHIQSIHENIKYSCDQCYYKFT